MRHPPSLYPSQVHRSAEVVEVLWLGAPALLAPSLAHLLAGAGSAVELALANTSVSGEVQAAVQTLALSRLRHHRLPSGQLKAHTLALPTPETERGTRRTRAEENASERRSGRRPQKKTRQFHTDQIKVVSGRRWQEGFSIWDLRVGPQNPAALRFV